MSADVQAGGGGSGARPASGLVGLWADLAPSETDRFRRWVDGELFPRQRGLPGLLRATYFDQVTHGSGAMLLYELASPDSPERSIYPALIEAAGPDEGGLAQAWRGAASAAYRLRTWHAVDGAGDLLDAACVLSVRLFVPAEWQDEVRRWLDEEHYERQLGVSGCTWYQGYESLSGRFNFLNLWGLASPEVIDLPAWAEARDTPWRERLMPAFAETGRAVYRRAR